MAFNDDDGLHNNADLYEDLYENQGDDNSVTTAELGLEEPVVEADGFDDDTFKSPELEFRVNKKAAGEYQFEDTNSEVDDEPLDLISSLLSSKGIEDLSRIQFENDKGEIEYHNFYDLDPQEQLAILQSNDADIDFGLSDDEVETINLLRSNSTTLKDVIDYYKREAIEEYLRDSVSESFSVDQMSNEELFVLNLKTMYDDFTDEELDIELTKELAQPELFEKKMNKLRQQYIESEAQKIEYDNEVVVAAQAKEFDQLVDNLVASASKVEDLGGLDLTDDDKNDVLDYILNKDVNGVSNFVKNLENHDSLFKMAWFAVKGEEAFSILHDYYKNQIEQVRRTTYEKAKKEFSTGTPVFQNRPKPGNQNRPTSIDDLYT